MLKLLKSDWYRIVRSPSFWGFLAVAVVAICLVAGLLHWISSPEFSVMVNESIMEEGQITSQEKAELETDIAEATPLNDRVIDAPTHLWAQTFLTGGLLAILGTLFIAMFLVSDFRDGFIKNLVTDRRGRRIYYLEKILLIGLIQAFYLILCTLVTTGAFAAFGFTFNAESFQGMVLWLFLTWLTMYAYAMIVACLVWATRSGWVGSLAALLISSGVIGAILVQVLQLLERGWAFLEVLPPWMLVNSTQLLGTGSASLLTADGGALWSLPAVHIVLVAVLYLAVTSVITFAVLRRRDIG